MDKLNKNKKNFVILSILVLEAVVSILLSIFLTPKLFITNTPLFVLLLELQPFGTFAPLFLIIIGLFSVITLYVAVTYFLITNEKYALPFFIFGIVMFLLNLPIHILFSANSQPRLFYIIMLVFSDFIIRAVLPPSFLILILKHMKTFEKQNIFAKTAIISAMMPLIMLFVVYLIIPYYNHAPWLLYKLLLNR